MSNEMWTQELYNVFDDALKIDQFLFIIDSSDPFDPRVIRRDARVHRRPHTRTAPVSVADNADL